MSSPTTAANAVGHQLGNKADSTNYQVVEGAGANHQVPARTSTEENRDHTQSDDAATIAAGEELRHTSISDKPSKDARREAPSAGSELPVTDKDMRDQARASTPEQANLR